MTSSGIKTPGTPHNKSGLTSRSESAEQLAYNAELNSTPANGMIAPNGYHQLPAFMKPDPYKHYDEDAGGWKGSVNRVRNRIRGSLFMLRRKTCRFAQALFDRLPNPVQKVLTAIESAVTRFLNGLWEFMNPPLWAMLIAIIVASIPALQDAFFRRGSFLRNSVTRAVEQSGGVAVPLILVVLGGNLARNTLPNDPSSRIADPKEERKLLIASLVSRMLLPTIIMAPFIALVAKYVPVSIVDDKIFLIVCFLLTGAPTALQLAQICQINNVYMPVMAKILFQSYVVWILPSTLILVLLALETVEWATV